MVGLGPILALGAVVGCQQRQPYIPPEDVPGDTALTTGGGGDTGDPFADCADGLSYARVGQPFALTWCTGCHSSALEGDDRKGAPDGIDFDTLAGLRANADRIEARIVAGTMPPGGGADAEMEAHFLSWLTCGGPGMENHLPVPVDDVAPKAIGEVSAQVTIDDVDSSQVVIRHYGPSIDQAPSALWEQIFLTSDDAVWFVGGRSYHEGEVVHELIFEPAVLIVDGDLSSWSVDTEATSWDPDGQSQESLQFEITVGEATNVDGHSSDLAPWMVMAVDDGGGEYGWHVSSEMGFVSQWYFASTGDGWWALQSLEIGGYASSELFPLEMGAEWSDRLIVYGDGL